MRKQKRVKTIIETPHTLLPNQFKSLHKCGGQLRKDNLQFFGKMYIYWYHRREILLVFSAVVFTGMVGGYYYWYGRR